MSRKNALICTLDSETEAGVLKLMENIAEAEVYVPIIENPKRDERIDPDTTKITRIDNIEFDEEGKPVCRNNYRPLTEEDFGKDGDRVQSAINKAVFQLISESEINYRTGYILTHDREDQHWHHAIVGNAVYHQRSFPWNILISGHDSFNGGLAKSVIIEGINSTDSDVYEQILKEIESETRYDVKAKNSNGLEKLALLAIMNSTRKIMRYSDVSNEIFKSIKWVSHENPIYLQVHPEYALKSLAEIETHRDVKWNKKNVPQKEIDRIWKEHYENLREMYKKCDGNWLEFMEYTIKEDADKNPKLYHSLTQHIAERLAVPVYDDEKYGDVSIAELTRFKELDNILYPISSKRLVNQESIYSPETILVISAHQDDPVIKGIGVF